MFIGKYNKSLIITYLGVICSVIGINYALNGNYRITMILLVVAGICDMFDGKVARMCKRTDDEKKFGVEIDSLADMVSFVLFPVVIGYSFGLNNWYSVVSYILLILAGITRLGFFNITVMDNYKDVPIKTYSGLPVTSTSIIIPLIWFISYLIKFDFKSIYTILLFIISLLFVLNFKIPKLKGKGIWIVTVLAVIGLILLIIL